MKKIVAKDERVVQVNNKLQSEGYVVIMVLLFMSVFVKSYILKLPFNTYMVELGVIVISSVYIMVRSMLLGTDFVETTKWGKKMNVFIVIITSLVVTIVNGVNNYQQYSDKYTGIFDYHFIAVLIITFLSFLIAISIMLAIIYFLNEKNQQRIEKKLDEEDMHV